MKKLMVITAILLIANTVVGLTQLELPATAQLKEMERALDQEIFPKQEVIEVKLTIDKTDFQDMLENPMDEEYKNASVDYNGYQFDNIAVRTKGNSSLSSVARMDSDRYSLKLNFDYYIDGQTLSGLSVINLNNNFSDATYLREYLTYQLLEEMGVPVPKTSFVNLYINDELWGLYLAVEQIDEPFLKRYYENASGDLYKPDGSGSDLVWKGPEMTNYTGIVLKTNKKTSDHSALLAMMQELNEGSDYEKYINVDGFLRYLAVSTALVNLDSYQGSLKHNYYLYEENGYFHFLPWDFNMSFAGFTMGGQSEGLKIDEPTQGDIEERPLISKILAVPAYKEAYHQYIEEIVNGFMSAESFTTMVNELVELIEPHVENDPTSFYIFEEFQEAIYSEETGIIAFTEARAENIKQQLSGEIASVKDGTENTGRNWGGGMQGPGGQFPGGEMPEGFQDRMPGGQFPEGEMPENLEGFMAEGQSPEEGQGQGNRRQEAGQQPRDRNQGMPGGQGGERGPFGGQRDTQENNSTPVGKNTIILIGLLMVSILIILPVKGKIRWNTGL